MMARKAWNGNMKARNGNHSYPRNSADPKLNVLKPWNIGHFGGKNTKFDFFHISPMLRRPSAPQWISKWQNIFGTFQIECENF